VNDSDNDAHPLETRDEQLYRQVHPSWVADGVPSSLAFRPTPKDEGMLSIALASKIAPEDAYLHHTKDLGFASEGTWAVTVGEAAAAGRGSFAQPLPDSPAHGFIDFRGLSRKHAEVAAKVLLARARERGRLYPPPATN
jgi:hypothetical protein